jgi:hypothetical protein
MLKNFVNFFTTKHGLGRLVQSLVTADVVASDRRPRLFITVLYNPDVNRVACMRCWALDLAAETLF